MGGAYVKAPCVGQDSFFGEEDSFGTALALSTDGSALAVGAPFESSAFTGAFAPGGAGYQAALDNDDTLESGGVTVYRHSDADRWETEAFVKAPVADEEDDFGTTLALSEDGSALAVGAPFEGSRFTGAFAPGRRGCQTVLESGSASDSGTVTVYRRSDSARNVEAFVKAPVVGRNDRFGIALALSEDGSALAAGAPSEDGGALSQPVGDGSADAGNAVNGSGAVYLY